MFVPYCENDTRYLQTIQGEVWWVNDKIVGFLRQRGPMTYAVRQAVLARGDRNDGLPANSTLKHYIPWIRIFRALTQNLLTGNSITPGVGMTREQSIKYLKNVMTQLGIDYKALAEPNLKASDNRASYDKWVSWAVDTICDYPDNLYQGYSRGDGNGTRVDVPDLNRSYPALLQTLGDAMKKLAVAIKGLNVGVEVVDAPPVLYEEYIPGEDEWFMPQ